MSPPLSIIIPALDAAASLPETLAALGEGRERGLVREVLVVDGGSRDGTTALARATGGRVIEAPRGRGNQLVCGAAAATGDWLLFLHADTRLGPGWAEAVGEFIAVAGNARRAGYLRYRLDDPAAAARRLEAFVAWRCRLLALPYGDQGLLIARRFYDDLGGFRPPPLPSPRPHAIAAAATWRVPCAISAASRSIFWVSRHTFSCGFTGSAPLNA